MRERFAHLLDGFSSVAARKRNPTTSAVVRFRDVLEGFCERRLKADALAQKQAERDHNCIRALLDGYSEAAERNRQRQEQVAVDFNLLEVMNLTGKEIRHSMVLAWLLDHDMRKLGTHAQGNLGFCLFIYEFGLPIEYAACKYWVRREVVGDESIVDVEVACRDRFLIHIENKIWSSEGIDQTDREWSDVQRRAAELNVIQSHIHGLFLTPKGTKAANANFRPIAWGRIAHVLEEFAHQAKPPDVKLFSAHYARALRRFIVVEGTSEEDDGQRTDE
ncbi:MAG TPA: PD-(D/E)XK nuclease family protein [Gemmataceae bacterium]|jgi:hypothetical protein|nr:PD-(D/E)XK nuclease family protein [Gemmataceae bacterium]